MHGSHAQRSVITDAQAGSSADLTRRQIRYTVAMSFRIVCFLAMFWVPSPWRWFLLGAAVVLPYIAVLIANQADQRTNKSDFERGEPTDDLPALDRDATLYLTESDPEPKKDDDRSEP